MKKMKPKPSIKEQLGINRVDKMTKVILAEEAVLFTEVNSAVCDRNCDSIWLKLRG